MTETRPWSTGSIWPPGRKTTPELLDVQMGRQLEEGEVARIRGTNSSASEAPFADWLSTEWLSLVAVKEERPVVFISANSQNREYNPSNGCPNTFSDRKENFRPERLTALAQSPATICLYFHESHFDLYL